MRAAREWAVAAAIAAGFLFFASRGLDAPGLNLDEAIETGYGMEMALGLPVSNTDWVVRIHGRRWPLRVPSPYDFSAFTAYWSALAFRVGGVSALTLRWAGLVSAALVLLAFFGFCREWFGFRTAALAAALAAAHPAFLLPARCSFYFSELHVLLPETFALWALSVWHRRRLPWALYLGAFLWAAGLNVSTKALAFIVAVPLAYALTARRAELPSRRQAAAAAACATLGALNPLLYILSGGRLTWNLLAALLAPTKRGVDNWALLHNGAVRLGHLLAALGGAPATIFVGEAPAVDRLSQAAFVASFAGLAALSWGRRGAGRRAVRGTLLLVAGLLACTCMTPAMLSPQHVLIGWPLPLLVVALGLSALARALPARAAWTGALPAALAACMLASEARVDAAFLAKLRTTGGAGLFSDAVTDLARYLDEHGVRAPLALEWGLSANVYVLTSGRVDPVEAAAYGLGADPGLARRWAARFADPGARLLVLADGIDPLRSRPLRVALDRALAASGRRLVVEKSFADRTGMPVYLLCSARPSASSPGSSTARK